VLASSSSGSGSGSIVVVKKGKKRNKHVIVMIINFCGLNKIILLDYLSFVIWYLVYAKEKIDKDQCLVRPEIALVTQITLCIE